MRIECFGARGTFPLTGVEGPANGRNTTCLAATSDEGEVLILDAGTGIRALGGRLAAEQAGSPRRLHLFFTHFHFDHIQGLPFFLPLYSASTEIWFYSALGPHSLRRTLSRFMAPPYFPAAFADTPARKKFFRVGDTPKRIGGIEILERNQLYLRALLDGRPLTVTEPLTDFYRKTHDENLRWTATGRCRGAST